MSDWPALDAFLSTDPSDAGCTQVMEMLHVYTELAQADLEAARARFPGMYAHLRVCGPCQEDFEGLLAAIFA